MRLLERRGWLSAKVLAGYALITFAYWGARMLPHPGRSHLGAGTDPQIFIWSFAWWPHALLHGQNPFVTHAIWAPSGVNLAWATTVPPLAVVFAPLTWIAGPVISFNVATVLMPALSAWTAFLLCRHLTHALWPALVGGYLFGFSSYMVGQLDGHLHLTSVFLLPLIVLVTVTYVEGGLGGRGLVVRLGPMLALQLMLSTEIVFTATLAVAVSLVLGWLLVPARRRRLVSLVPPLAASYAFAAVLAAPFLYYALSAFDSAALNLPQWYTTDLLNLVVPTRRFVAGGHWARGVAQHFAGNDAERDAYLGLPAVAIIGMFTARRWRNASVRFLLAAALVALIASSGSWFEVDGHKLMTAPWEHVQYLPVFKNVLPSRLMLYVILIGAVMVALWTAGARGRLRVVLPALAVLALVPDIHLGFWQTQAYVPAFIRDDGVRRCLAPGENVLIFPQAVHGDGMLWQAVSGFRFRMADGYVRPNPPSSFMTTPAATRIAERQVTWPDLVAFAREKHVTTVLVDARQSAPWRRILRPLAPPREVGGVLVYRFDKRPRC